MIEWRNIFSNATYVYFFFGDGKQAYGCIRALRAMKIDVWMLTGTYTLLSLPKNETPSLLYVVVSMYL